MSPFVRYRLFALAAVVLLAVSVSACGTKKDVIPAGATDPDKFLYEKGKETLDKKRWMTAREYFRRIIDGYPQSLLRPDAKLGVGDTAALLGSHARSVEAEYLVQSRWAQEITVPRDVLRRRVSVAVTGDSDFELARDPGARSARLPHAAFETIRAGLATGPVLVQTPRAGYATRLACERCRAPAECPTCHGPLRLTDARRPMAPMEQLRERWPHTLVLDFRPADARVEPAADLARLRETTDPVEVCAAFMEWVDSTRPDRAHEDTLRSAVEAVRRLEASA